MIDHPRLDFRGASVTIPHKENLLRFVRERGGRSDALTDRIGAANTLIVGSAGGLSCTNTDCPAAVEALRAGMGIEREDISSLRLAVMGAGGAARAVIAGLADAGAAVTVFNRTESRAVALVEDLGGGQTASGDRAQVEVGEASEMETERFDVYANCTSVGMAGGPDADGSPLPEDAPLDDRTTVFDTVYNPVRTPLIAEAEARGARVVTGLDMFINQAAMQFERWTGEAAPIELFERTLRSGQ
jgi:3-dehydroquinate dehydratase/shikimate dehydrogenase